MTEDVTSLAGGGPRTMLALLSATTLVLVAGVPWMLPAAAGERRGVQAQAEGWARVWAVGALEVSAPGGWRAVRAPPLVRGHGAQIETLEAAVFQRIPPRRLLGGRQIHPRAGHALPAGSVGFHRGVLGEPEPSCRLCFSSMKPVAGLDP